jgi:hypothetical protein
MGPIVALRGGGSARDCRETGRLSAPGGARAEGGVGAKMEEPRICGWFGARPACEARLLGGRDMVVLWLVRDELRESEVSRLDCNDRRRPQLRLPFAQARRRGG